MAVKICRKERESGRGRCVCRELTDYRRLAYDSQGNLRTIQRIIDATYGEGASPVETRFYNALSQLSRIEDAQFGALPPALRAPVPAQYALRSQNTISTVRRMMLMSRRSDQLRR
jgi:hypothetical protein